MEAAKGGHTTVVQLLIDWPGAQRVDVSLAHAAVPPPPPSLNLPSCAEVSSTTPMANVLPQFILPGSSFNAAIGADGQSAGAQQLDGSSFLTYKDPLTQAEKALLKQASEKLSAAELQQLQELLKAQFQETAAQLANRVQSTNAPNVRVGGGSATSTSTSSTSNSNNAKSKKAELEAAMKELEQLKKTQQLYEQLQRALEQKDEKTLAGRQNSKNKSSKLQQQSTSAAIKKDFSTTAPPPLVLPPVPPPSPPPPPPPPLPQPPAAAGREIIQQQSYSPSVVGVGGVPPTTQQMLSFQLPSLDPAQLQYLQQQFSLALSAQNFQFQMQNQQQTTTNGGGGGGVFPSLSLIGEPQPQPTAAMIDLSHNHSNHSSSSNNNNNVYVPSPVQPPQADLNSLNNVVGQNSAFNFSLPSSGFNFTPAHLLPQVAGGQSSTPPTIVPHTVYGNAAKSTQTTTEPLASYQPQVGAFQPTNAYSLTANLLSQTAAVLANNNSSTMTTTTQTTTAMNNLNQQQQILRSGVDLNTQTESNHDTALTLACAGGHEELVMLLLQRGADLEHQDKKGAILLFL